MKLIKPMEPVLSSKIIEGDDWIHQIKWDGIRGLIYIYNGGLRIFTKRGKERTGYYPELNELLKLFKGNSCILDGEMVALNDEGKPSFERSLTRETVKSLNKVEYYKKKYPVNYIIFDLLNLNDKDLRKEPLRVRRELLVSNLDRNSNITITDDFQSGKELFDLMVKKGWEGIVSKNINSQYLGGKNHRDWYKTKIIKRMLTVIGGIQWKRDVPKSLLLGIYREGKLYYVGHASGGLKQRDFRILKDNIHTLQQIKNPFINLKNDETITWVKPLLTCWVTFFEWTSSGHLRHPQIVGFSNKAPEEADGREFSDE